MSDNQPLNARNYSILLDSSPNLTVPNSGYLTPPQISTAYNVPASDGAGMKIGIISLGGGFKQSDLDADIAALKTAGLLSPSTVSPTIQVVPLSGATNTDSVTIQADASAENTLDVYCVATMVPAATIVLYITSSTLVSGVWDGAFQRAIDDNCDVITHSWGYSEVQGTFCELAFAAAHTKKIPIVIASGDYGSSPIKPISGTNPGEGVQYPASSPYVIPIGGTHLTLSPSNTRSSETPENTTVDPGYPSGWGGGGGTSTYFTVPGWQAGLTYKTCDTSTNVSSPIPLTWRGLPDISAPMNGYVLHFNGNVVGYGGTSAAAPFMAGVLARLKKLSGQAKSSQEYNTSWYAHLNAFYDVTVGNNATYYNGYAATSGWDPVVGLGAPDGSSLLSLVTGISNDANLSDLTISSGTLSPSFSMGTTSYTDTVINSVSSVTVTPTRNQSNATITVNGTVVTSGSASGAISLSVGANIITVVVTAQDGTTTKTYTITVNRVAAVNTDATLASLTVSAGTFTPAFDPATTSYTNTVTNSQASVSISASTSQPSSTLTLNGVTWDGTASTVNLSTGSNVKTIIVTAPDTITFKPYTVDIVRLTAFQNTNSPTYGIVPNTTVVSEGSTITYTISTTNVANGTTLYWTNAGTTGAADFSDNTNSGSITVTGGSATLTRTLLNDTLTEGTETVLIQLRSGSISGGILAVADSVAVIDSSTGSSGQYDIFPSTRFLIRGNSITFTVRTSGLSNGTFLFWNNIGTSSGADFVGGQNSGQFLITNNQGSFTIQLLDIVSTGSKTIIIQLHSGSPSGTVVATSDTTTIYDHGLIIQASDYNNMFTTLNRLMGKNSLGYGAALKSTSTSVGKVITTSTWLDAIADLQKCSIHQVGSIDTSLVTIGNTIFNHNIVKAIDVGGINEAAQILYTNSGTVHPSQLTSVTSNPKSSASSWTTSTATNIGFTWRDIADVNYFFNLGSVIKPQISVSGADASLWQPLVDQANLVTFSKPEFYATNFYFRNYSNGGRTLSIAYGVIGAELIASAIFSTSTANVTSIAQFAATYSVGTSGGIAAPVPSVQVINGSLTVSPNPIPTITTKANETALVNLTFTNNTDQPCTINSINNVNHALIFSHAAMPVTILANSSITLPITYQCGISALYQDQILVQSSLGEIILPTVVKVNLNVYSSPDNNWTLPNVTVDDLLGRKFIFSVDGGGYTIDAFTKTGTNADQFTISQATPLDVSAFFDPKIQINGLHTMNIVTRVVPTDPNIDIINVNIPVSITTNIVNQHLGSWLGPQSRANSAIGMSYDIIGGRRTLTVGFGTDQARNQQSFGLYGAMRMLGVLGNSNTSIVGYPYQDGAYGGFLLTYGVWRSPGGAGTGAWDITGTPITFYVNASGTYNYEFSVDNSGTVYIDGNTIVTYSDYTTAESGTVYLAAGAHTVSWNVYNSGGPGAVGFRLYNASNNTDLWSTLSIAPKWGNWYDVFRIPLTGQPATLYSSPAYQIQSTGWYNGNTISSYFGAGTSAGSIITVNDDGLGNLGILLNPVGSQPGDGGEFDITVGDTTYAFNYADGLSNRYFNLEDPIGSQTHIFTGFDQAGNVQTSLVTYNPPPAAGGGGGDSFPWWIVLVPFGLPPEVCFTEDTIIDMADGTQKRIIDVKEGEFVFNHDKTSVNLVTLTECDITPSKYILYSPKAGMDPFATVNHPLIIDGVMYAVDPEENYKVYPWLGKNEKLVTDKIVETDQKVYSLWVNGDETFRVNGYGTHSIFGDGGGLLDCYQRKVLTKDEVLMMRQKFVDYGNNAIYGGYLYNNFLAWANIKLLTDCSAAILKSDSYPVLEKIIMTGMKAIGMVARTWKKLSKGK